MEQSRPKLIASIAVAAVFLIIVSAWAFSGDDAPAYKVGRVTNDNNHDLQVEVLAMDENRTVIDETRFSVWGYHDGKVGKRLDCTGATVLRVNVYDGEEFSLRPLGSAEYPAPACPGGLRFTIDAGFYPVLQ